MKKIKTKVGYIAYQTTIEETTKWGGVGVCDHCNKTADMGYLVSVLNHWVCPDCYKEWDSTAIYYAEDIEVESRNADYYESLLPVTQECEETKEHGHLKPFRILGGVPKGTCQECATKHEPEQPHNQQSLTYQYKFYDQHGRWPTWADAMAHCTDEIKTFWIEELKKHGAEVTV